MSLGLSKKVVVAILVVAGAAAAINFAPSSIGQEAKKTDKTEKKAKGRLPAYYADIVTDEQRTQIYTIQSKHQEKISELTAQLLAATKAMNAEIEGVLSADQKVKLKAAQDAGAAKKKKAGTEKKAAEDAKKAAPAETKTTTKSK